MSDCSFGWGLRIPNLGEEEAAGGRDGAVQKSDGDDTRSIFLYLYAFQR